MDNQLVLGVVLIVVGIALALLAYAFILNRREQDKGPGGATPEPSEAPVAAEVASPSAPRLPPAPAVEPPATPAPIAVPSIPLHQAAATPPPPAPTPTAAPPSPASAPVPSRRTLAVATLLRDEVTGKLSVLVGGREYANAEDLRASRDYARVEYATADLVQWLGATAVRERTAERVKEEAKKPLSMIEQIDEILQRKMTELAGAPRGVRLVEGAGGSLRVFIGVQSYAFEDVPDAEVKSIIREAVAEWESKK
jgi:hypothetical protein